MCIVKELHGLKKFLHQNKCLLIPFFHKCLQVCPCLYLRKIYGIVVRVCILKIHNITPFWKINTTTPCLEACREVGTLWPILFFFKLQINLKFSWLPPLSQPTLVFPHSFLWGAFWQWLYFMHLCISTNSSTLSSKPQILSPQSDFY